MILSSTLALVWLGCGLVAVVTMLAVLGGKGEAWGGAKRLRWVHRFFGFAFSLGYVGFLIYMLPRYQANGPLLATRFVLHAYLGMALLGLLLVKHMVVRLFKKFYPALPYLGALMFTVALGVAGLTGLNNLLLWAKGPLVVVKTDRGPRWVSVALGRDVLHHKCARCHTLQPTYLYRKSEAEWRLTVKRMGAKQPGLLLPSHADYMVGYLAAELGEE